MLDIPGNLDSQRLPNAVAVVRALKNDGPGKARFRQICRARAPSHDEIDLEGDAHAEKNWHAMMFAKLSGIPMSTVISSVTRPARAKGIKVKSTSYPAKNDQEKQADR